jgi:histidyl-tRNA synthetase
MEYADKSLKAQMKRANRLGAGRVLIVGESEMKSGTVVLRDMATKNQQEIPLDTVVETLISILNEEF